VKRSRTKNGRCIPDRGGKYLSLEQSPDLSNDLVSREQFAHTCRSIVLLRLLENLTRTIKVSHHFVVYCALTYLAHQQRKLFALAEFRRDGQSSIHQPLIRISFPANRECFCRETRYYGYPATNTVLSRLCRTLYAARIPSAPTGWSCFLS
jgi:hypothetical protein